MGKYSVCPICGKKGLYSEWNGFTHAGRCCRYCGVSWAVSRRRIGQFKGKCPFCHCKPVGGGTIVFTHYCPYSKERIAKSIERERHQFECKQANHAKVEI